MSADEMQQFLDIFLQESSDRFDELNTDLVKLETAPSDEGVLYSILRHVHSIKGSAGMFGFDNLKRVAHRMEDLMELAHATPERVNRSIMDILFEGADILQGMFSRITEGNHSTELTHHENAFLEHLDETILHFGSGGNTLESLSQKILDEVEDLLDALEEQWDSSALRETMAQMRKFLSKTESGEQETVPDRLYLLGEQDVTGALERLQKRIAHAEHEALSDEESVRFFEDMTHVLDAADQLQLLSMADMLGEARESMKMFSQLDLDFDQLQAEYFKEIINEIMPNCQVLETHGDPVAVISAKAAAKGEIIPIAGEPATDISDSALPSLGIRKTVRIEENKIDAFLDSVGEMIILGEAFNYLEKRLSASVTGNLDLLREFRTTNSTFGTQIFALQDALMNVRRVEVRNITGSLNRLVRDTARELGKEVKFIVDGESAVVDKSMLDDLNTSIVHVVRNAIDHGLESGDERVQSGKPLAGRIELNAKNEDGFLFIEVSDDGRGINADRLRAKAVEHGLHSPESARALTDQEAIQLVFHNGVSTAQAVSDVSGRGVGMSAVAENIRKMSGSIEISSVPGKGTSITLKIPLSIMLSVIDGLVVKCSDTGFVIPIRHVVESFHPEPGQFHTVQGKGECVVLRGELHPLLRLGDYFRLPGKRINLAAENGTLEPGREGVGILVQNGNEDVCLFVDSIIDHQQVVIKKVEGLEKLPGILGGCLLGDGTIGLVLNVEDITP